VVESHEWTKRSIEVHNSRRPLVRLTLTLTLTFDLWPNSLVGEVSWWTICMPSLTVLVSTVLVLSCGHTDRITEAHDCYTHATTIGVSNKSVEPLRNIGVPIIVVQCVTILPYLYFRRKCWRRIWIRWPSFPISQWRRSWGVRTPQYLSKGVSRNGGTPKI